jgi:hypothetical protein
MNQQEEQAFMNLQAKLAQSETNVSKAQQAVTMFQAGEDDNLVKWQLDIKETLVRAERFLRGQVPKSDEKGNIIYVEEAENKILNQKGINEMMKTLSIFVSKEIILSDYKDKQIDVIMRHFSNRLIDDLYFNAENYGLDTMEKMMHLPMLIWTLISIVDATYRRSKDGGERTSLKTARMVSQTEPLGRMMQIPQMNRARGGIFNPANWGRLS